MQDMRLVCGGLRSGKGPEGLQSRRVPTTVVPANVRGCFRWFWSGGLASTDAGQLVPEENPLGRGDFDPQ